MSYTPTFIKRDLRFTFAKYFAFLGSYADTLGDWAIDETTRGGYLLQVSEVGSTIMAQRLVRTSNKVERFLSEN